MNAQSSTERAVGKAAKRLRETDRVKMIAQFIKTGIQPEGYTIRDDGNGGYRVAAVKNKDPAEIARKKRERYIMKLIEVDPSLEAILRPPQKQPDIDHDEEPI